MNDQIIVITSAIIFGIALMAGFVWLFDSDETPDNDDETDYNDRTG
jgi:hypothetical protein